MLAIGICPSHIPTPKNPYTSFDLFENSDVLFIHRECTYDNSEIDIDERIYRRWFKNLKKLIDTYNYVNEVNYQDTAIKRLTFNLREAY